MPPALPGGNKTRNGRGSDRCERAVDDPGIAFNATTSDAVRVADDANAATVSA
jgi:hypothetical protein